MDLKDDSKLKPWHTIIYFITDLDLVGKISRHKTNLLSLRNNSNFDSNMDKVKALMNHLLLNFN